MQLVYSSLEEEHVSILGILSGNLKNIELLENTSKYIAHYKVLDLDYEGVFQFNKNSGLLKSITLTIDAHQYLSVKVKSVDFIIYNDMPNINYDNFEIIDFRD